MTQRIKAERLIDKIVLPDTELIRQLRDVLGASQNGPPHGEADDSIDEKAWQRLKCIIDASTLLVESVNHFRRIR